MTTRDHIHRAASVGITALMLTLSVAVPVLERSEVVNEPVAESQHDPGTCPRGHDHTVCTQVGANAAAPSPKTARRVEDRVVAVAAPTRAPTVASAAFPDGHPSRAPPLA